ncbi:hypothetical protein PoB_000361600 [Plakobranchus ocellatus]|uniref:Integrase catalytic domain-containing protein n=1 Tax=Plakobranchus ocellatus TaxID=259542 RepID=A0AAV3Y3X5_9GAST|nr:hypothetical protein PoB_000361600 [Plakobranchus ocellatus]
MLYRSHPESNVLQLVVPEDLQEEKLKMGNDVPNAGHQGVNRTEEILQKYWWYHCRSHIKRYVNTCAICNSMKKRATPAPKYPLTLYHTSCPMERVHLDFLGPLPKTKPGNEYVLMIMDQFTKWVERFPLPSQTAEVTASTAVREFFSRFGCPL